MTESLPAYSLRGVRFGYGTETILRDLTADLPAGRMVGILGPNGEGKTTLLRILLGSLRPEAGSVELFGRPLREISGDERARMVAYLPQEVSTAYPFRVSEVVLLGRYPHLPPFALESPRDWGIAKACMERTEVSHLADRPFTTLSGGEKQRVLIASVLAQEPRVLLLDEPTAALDLHHQYAVMDLLRTLHEEGITVVIVTHDVTLAAGFCDHLWLLSGGRVILEGPPSETVTEESLRRLYGMRLRVVTDEDTGLPIVLPVRGELVGRCV